MTDNSWMSQYILSLRKESIKELMDEMLMYHRIYILNGEKMPSKEFTLYKECQSELIKRYVTIKDMVNGENK